MEQNDRYKIQKIHNGLDKKGDLSESTQVVYKEFEMKGKYYFDGLDLRKEEWKRIHPSINQHRTSPKETFVYSGPQGTVIMHLNYETDNHQVGILLKSYSGNNPKTIEDIKLMLERGLEGKLNEKEEFPISNLIDLIDKIESN